MDDQPGFETLAIHAGQEPDADDRRGHHADLPDLDLRAGRRRRAARRLRLQPQRQPDPHGARGVPRRARGRPCAASRSPAGSAAEDTLLRTRLRAGRPRRHSRRRLRRRRSGCSTRCSSRWGLRYTAVDQTDLDAVRAAVRDETALVWCETPTNPLLRDRRHRRAGRDRARGRRAARRRQHLRLALPPAAARARRRHRRALDDEVPRRAHRRRRRLRSVVDRPGARRAARASSRTSIGAVAGAVRRWLVLRGHQDARRADGSALRQRRAASSRCCASTPAVDAGATIPGSRHPGHEVAADADARLRRHGVVPGRGRRGDGARGLPHGRSCSRWPSRSAASSR